MGLAIGSQSMRVGVSVLLILMLVIISGAGSKAADGEAASDCSAVASDGEQWLKPLCEAISIIAKGEKTQQLKIPDAGRAKVWRNENGTSVDIDFYGGTVGSAVIARLLSGSSIIDADRVDLLVIRRATIKGTLDLSHADIKVATDFLNVNFNPLVDGTCDPAAPRPPDPKQVRRSLVLVAASATKRLSIQKSKLCGDLEIASARLAGGIHLRHVHLPALFVIKSQINAEVLIEETVIHYSATFDRSAIDALTIARSELKSSPDVGDNQYGLVALHERQVSLGCRVRW
jgi:hypothetical protein